MAGRRRGWYPPEYKERIVELVRGPVVVWSLSRANFEPSEQTIRNWVKQADLDEGLWSDGLTTEARKEMRRLKREDKRLRTERDILTVHDLGGPPQVSQESEQRPRIGVAETCSSTGARRCGSTIAASCRPKGVEQLDAEGQAPKGPLDFDLLQAPEAESSKSHCLFDPADRRLRHPLAAFISPAAPPRSPACRPCAPSRDARLDRNARRPCPHGPATHTRRCPTLPLPFRSRSLQ